MGVYLNRYVAIAGTTLACVTLLLAGCNRDSAEPTPTTSEGSPSASAPTQPTSTPTSPASPDTIPNVVGIAMQVAARDGGVSLDQVSLLSYSRQEWTTSALGCPEPGKGYAQVITPGYAVRLLVAGVEVEYHTDLVGNVVRCPSP
jgi:hypothetical protein